LIHRQSQQRGSRPSRQWKVETTILKDDQLIFKKVVTKMQRVDFSLAVHGGAWNMPVAVIDSHIIGRQNALEVVEEILIDGG
jgi:hypothetical protein